MLVQHDAIINRDLQYQTKLAWFPRGDVGTLTCRHSISPTLHTCVLVANPAWAWDQKIIDDVILSTALLCEFLFSVVVDVLAALLLSMSAFRLRIVISDQILRSIVLG